MRSLGEKVLSGQSSTPSHPGPVVDPPESVKDGTNTQ